MATCFPNRTEKITVALDVSRLIVAIEKNWIYTGITKYTERLYAFLQNESYVDVIPVLTARDAVLNPTTRKALVSMLGREPEVLIEPQKENDNRSSRFDIYHSTINPLPSHRIIGNAKKRGCKISCVNGLS